MDKFKEMLREFLGKCTMVSYEEKYYWSLVDVLIHLGMCYNCFPPPLHDAIKVVIVESASGQHVPMHCISYNEVLYLISAAPTPEALLFRSCLESSSDDSSETTNEWEK